MMPERADQRRGGDDGVKTRVRAGGDQRLGVVLHTLGLDVAAQRQLDDHRHRDDDKGDGAVVRRLGGDDLLDRFHQRGCARCQHNGRDHNGAEILDAPVAEGVLCVRAALGELDAEYRDDGAQRVCEVIDRVEHDGDGAREQTRSRLEPGEKEVGRDADQAGAGDLPLADICIVHRMASCRIQNF